MTLSLTATTWDEPWQKEIIEKSDYFIYGEVISNADSLIEILVLSNFSSKETSDTIQVTGFHLLDLCSLSSGDIISFDQEPGTRGYLLLKSNDDGDFELPTPTSGFDKLVDGLIYATYRHSYHQAGISPAFYEFTYTQIWNKIHGLSYDSIAILAYVDSVLAYPPAGFGSEESVSRFYCQHVALETAYLMGLTIEKRLLLKFMEDEENFHNQVSGIRAMGVYRDEASLMQLYELVKKENDGENQLNFQKVIAIWEIRKSRNTKVIRKLKKLRKKVSDDDTGFGGNLMDPRVCTYFPTPRQAIEDVIENAPFY